MINTKIFSLFLGLCIFEINCAPRHKSSGSSTTFDQKQTGEYNIQLHLKDFQIIAVVGDDSFGSLGDYDYDYDYSDFTIKPNPSLTITTTKKPTEASTPSTTLPTTLKETIFDELTQKTTTKKPLPTATHPYPIISPSTTVKLTTIPSIGAPTTKKQEEIANELLIVSSTTLAPQKSESLENVHTVSTTAPPPATPSSTVNPVKIITTTAPPPNTIKKSTHSLVVTSRPAAPIPGQIPVIVQNFSIIRNETPIVKNKNPEDRNPEHPELNKDKRGEGITSITIVPLDDGSDGNFGDVMTLNEQPALGEILHYRRCAQGYQRDKRGRCRKVRRPQIPLELTRFASNFAARFRQTGLTGSNGSSSEADSDDTSNVHLKKL